MSEQFKQQPNNPEQARENLAEIVKNNLNKYKDEVEQFSLFTTSKEGNGGVATNSQLRMVSYDNRYDKDYEFQGFKERNSLYTSSHENGYVIETFPKDKSKLATIIGYMGRALHTPERPGNGFYVTLKFKKESEHYKELIESIYSLFQTLKEYDNNDTEEDIKNILKQGLPILKAFEDFSKNMPDVSSYGSKGYPISKLIQEFKDLLSKYDN
jgi:hypothetical protein